MTASETDTTWTTDTVVTVIREMAQKSDLPEHLIEGAITAEDTVDSLGIDSIGGVYLIERFEEMTGVLMPDDFIELKLTIGDIAQRLNALVREQG